MERTTYALSFCFKIFEWFTLGLPVFFLFCPKCFCFPRCLYFGSACVSKIKAIFQWKIQHEKLNDSALISFFASLFWCDVAFTYPPILANVHTPKITKPAKAIVMRTTFELEKHQLNWCTNNDFFDLLAFWLSFSLFSHSLNSSVLRFVLSSRRIMRKRSKAEPYQTVCLTLDIIIMVAR